MVQETENDVEVGLIMYMAAYEIMVCGIWTFCSERKYTEKKSLLELHNTGDKLHSTTPFDSICKKISGVAVAVLH